ncbi:MAG: Ig-like domain-containing protein [Acidimicrobiia bacterium]
MTASLAAVPAGAASDTDRMAPTGLIAVDTATPRAPGSVQDGGFEAGVPNPYWGEASTNFGTPLCDDTCGASGAHAGDWWVWFGGIDIEEAGAVVQTITIPADATALTFYLEIPVADVDSFFEAWIDEVAVFAATEVDQASYATYLQVTVDISAYADGASHDLGFVSWKADGGPANYYLDDVAITSGATTGTVTGVVRHNGSPLAGVEVWLGYADRHTCTLGDGTFAFAGIPTDETLVAATGPALALPCSNASFVNGLGQPLGLQGWDHKRGNEPWTEFTVAAGEVKVINFDVLLREPPVAVDDTASVASGGTVMIDVLSNDANPEGEALNIVKVSDPSHGTANWSAGEGRFVYTHDGSYATTDSFTYKLLDSVMESAPGTVSISIEQPPAKAPTVGLQDPATGQWHLRDASGAVTSFYYGNPGDFAFMGDWDCDGDATPGLFRQSDAFAYLRNANSQGNADIRFFFGNPSDIPIAGDFNGNGCDTLSIYRPESQTFFIMNQLGQNEGGLGAAEYSFGFGNPGDKPVVGDWDGDGVDEIGLHRESSGFFYYRNTLTTGNADGQFFFGDPGDRFVAGDWGVVDYKATPAVFRPGNSTFYFRHTMTEGNADSSMAWGKSGFMPVSGDFGVLSGGGGITPPPAPTPTPGGHPTSGPGWQLVACNSLVETSVYRTSDECAQITVQKSAIPADYRQCIYFPDPFNPQCTDHRQWDIEWFGPNGELNTWSAHYNYSGMFLSSIDFRTPIDAEGLVPGEYRAEFCRTVWPNSFTCVEDLFTAYFTITN